MTHLGATAHELIEHVHVVMTDASNEGVPHPRAITLTAPEYDAALQEMRVAQIEPHAPPDSSSKE